MEYAGPEKRKYPRINARFVVSYRILREDGNVDISQAKNISLGGMLLTTNRKFEPGTVLALDIRLPFDINPIIITAKVIDSREVTKDLIYDTRIIFLDVDERHKNTIDQTVNFYLKKGK